MIASSGNILQNCGYIQGDTRYLYYFPVNRRREWSLTAKKRRRNGQLTFAAAAACDGEEGSLRKNRIDFLSALAE